MLIDIDYLEKSWQVESSHRHPDTGEKIFYTVEEWSMAGSPNKGWRCNCIAGQMRRKCKHIKYIEQNYN